VLARIGEKRKWGGGKGTYRDTTLAATSPIPLLPLPSHFCTNMYRARHILSKCAVHTSTSD